MQITVTGYHGMNNLGDDLMFLTFLKEIARVMPKLKIKLLSEGDSFDFLGSGDLEELNIEVFPLRKCGNAYMKLRTVIKALKGSEHLIWVGGTCFTDEDGDGGFKKMVIAKLLGKKIGYIGVGMGNLKRISRLIKTYLLVNLSEAISLRDDVSYRLAAGMLGKRKSRAFITEDLAYLYDYSYVPRHTGEEYILISWRNLDRYEGQVNAGLYLDKLVKNIETAVDVLGVSKITVMPVDDSEDMVTNKTIYERLTSYGYNTQFEAGLSVQGKLGLIANAKYYVTVRLYSAIAAEIFSVNYAVLNYSPKILRFMESIESDRYFKIDDLSNESFLADFLHKRSRYLPGDSKIHGNCPDNVYRFIHMQGLI